LHREREKERCGVPDGLLEGLVGIAILASERPSDVLVQELEVELGQLGHMAQDAVDLVIASKQRKREID